MLVPLAKPNFSIRFDSIYQTNAKKDLPLYKEYYEISKKIQPMWKTWKNNYSLFKMQGGRLLFASWESFAIEDWDKQIDITIKALPRVISQLKKIASGSDASDIRYTDFEESGELWLGWKDGVKEGLERLSRIILDSKAIYYKNFSAIQKMSRRILAAGSRLNDIAKTLKFNSDSYKYLYEE